MRATLFSVLLTVCVCNTAAFAQQSVNKPTVQPAKQSTERGSNSELKGDVNEVKKTLAALIDVQLKYDASAVDQFLDGAFIYVSNDGSVMSRTEFVNLTDCEKNPLDLLEVTAVEVRTSGDTAIATGLGHEKGLLYGKPYEFRGRTLITFARKNGRWLCLAIHD